MRPLYAPATECRPSLHKALKLVFATNHNLLFHWKAPCILAQESASRQLWKTV